MYIKFTVVTSTRVNLPEAYYYYYQHIVIVISTMHTEPQTSSVLTARRNVSTFIFLFDFVQQSWDTGTGQRPMHSSVSTQKTGPGSDGDLGSHENAGLDFCPCVLLAFYVTTRFVILLDPGAHIMHLKEKKYPVSERGPN
ncbi:hypothetical protein TREES_T100014278 [Tupaia chinensis]|uniref:Uncharacterized protein n=1 Tax=Tupaia chinensis TaxID=246437 RepID=L9JE59_TUPCH|nr:hypothetical protein TREES_T100014278 [Tupaia chinensis]